MLLTVGETIAAAAPGVHTLWMGQALAGLGAAALFPISLAMIASGTHTARDRARAIALWAGFLSAGGFIAPSSAASPGTTARGGGGSSSSPFWAVSRSC